MEVIIPVYYQSKSGKILPKVCRIEIIIEQQKHKV